MGYWKPVYLEEDLSLPMSGTKTFELPESGDISYLELILKLTNGAAANYTNNPEYSISNLSVLHHGNHVVKSFDGRIALFSAAKDMPKVSELQVYDPGTSRYQINRIPILFGKKPFDKEHFLRMQDMGDCTLKLTRDFTTGSEYKTGTDYLATAKVETDLIAWQWFGTPALPPPKGFIKSSLVKEWSPTTNSEKENFKPATGNKWRNFIIQMEAAAWWMEQKIAEVQFDENNESPIFYKRITEDLEIENMQQDHLVFKTIHRMPAGAPTSILAMIGGPRLPHEGGRMILTPTAVTTAPYPYFGGGSGNKRTIYSDANFVAEIEGTAYQECLLLNLERMFNDLYESEGKSAPRLRLTAAAAGIAVILPKILVHLEELIEPPYLP